MSHYDPFERGPLPVGVRSVELTDPSRDRTLPVELWYPASDEHRGQDLDGASRDHFRILEFAPEVAQDAVRDARMRDGELPLIVFSHGFGGDRRQTTHLCTHWASHGYLVAAMDHVGNTTVDLMQMAASPPQDPEALVGRFIADRPADASFVIDCMLAGESGLRVDASRIGMSGHSFGGWTTLMTVGRDSRVRAALPLAPAGGETPLVPGGFANDIAGALELDWDREVPTLYLVAEFDTLLPLAGMKGLIDRTPAPRKAISLRSSDHFHFCDRVEEVHGLFKAMGGMIGVALGEGAPDLQEILSGMKESSELCPGEHAYALLRGLGLAHMDAHVKGEVAAVDFLEQDLRSVMASRGVEIDVL